MEDSFIVLRKKKEEQTCRDRKRRNTLNSTIILRSSSDEEKIDGEKGIACANINNDNIISNDKIITNNIITNDNLINNNIITNNKRIINDNRITNDNLINSNIITNNNILSSNKRITNMINITDSKGSNKSNNTSTSNNTSNTTKASKTSNSSNTIKINDSINTINKADSSNTTNNNTTNKDNKTNTNTNYKVNKANKTNICDSINEQEPIDKKHIKKSKTTHLYQNGEIQIKTKNLISEDVNTINSNTIEDELTGLKIQNYLSDDSQSNSTILNDKENERNCTKTVVALSADERRVSIFTNTAIPKFDTRTSFVFLPQSFKMLSDLFKAMRVVFHFNLKRNINFLFYKSKESLERMLKRRIEIEYLEKIKFLAKETVCFTKIAATKEFKIELADKVDFDLILYNYFSEKYKEWADLNEIEDYKRIDRRFNKEDLKIPRMDLFTGELVELLETGTNKMGISLEKYSESNSIIIINKDILNRDNDNKYNNGDIIINNAANYKYGKILERIKEKERLRREAFKNEAFRNSDISKKIENLFLINRNKALLLDDLIFKIAEFDCKSKILKMVEEGKYNIKSINNVEYLIKK